MALNNTIVNLVHFRDVLANVPSLAQDHVSSACDFLGVSCRWGSALLPPALVSVLAVLCLLLCVRRRRPSRRREDRRALIGAKCRRSDDWVHSSGRRIRDAFDRGTVPHSARWLNLKGVVTSRLATLRPELRRHTGAPFEVVGTQHPPDQIQIRVDSNSKHSISVEEAAAGRIKPRAAQSSSLHVYHSVVDECFEELEKVITEQYPVPASQRIIRWFFGAPRKSQRPAAKMPSRMEGKPSADFPGATERMRDRGVLRVHIRRASGLKAPPALRLSLPATLATPLSLPPQPALSDYPSPAPYTNPYP